jgi:ribosomal protein S20
MRTCRKLHNLSYLSELRDWVQNVISEAEKNKDFKKKEQFSRLLKDLKDI